MSLAKAKADLAEISMISDYLQERGDIRTSPDEAEYVYRVQVLKLLSSIANSLVFLAEKEAMK